MRAVTARLDRQLVAVMFTDVVGYTALMQTDERVAIDKRDRDMRALEGHHDDFGGTIVQRLGDGSMSMFPSSLAAVSAAVAIQRELTAHDVPVRIGVHVGEVIVEAERLTGDAVSIGSSRSRARAVSGRHVSWSNSVGRSLMSSSTELRSSRWPTSPTPRSLSPLSRTRWT